MKLSDLKPPPPRSWSLNQLNNMTFYYAGYLTVQHKDNLDQVLDEVRTLYMSELAILDVEFMKIHVN